MIDLSDAMNVILGGGSVDNTFWSKKCQIPLGSKKPFEMYDGGVPLSEVVTIPFDAVSLGAGSKRTANNILVMGGSGDGKTLLMKVAMFVLWKAGYHILAVESVKDEVGWAQTKWEASNRLPPFLKPEGIKLVHYLPLWAALRYELKRHNFVLYSNDLGDIDNKELWRELGMTRNAANFTMKVFNECKAQGDVTISSLVRGLENLVYSERQEDIKTHSSSSVGNAIRVLQDLEADCVVIDPKNREILEKINQPVTKLNMLKTWSEGRACVVSYVRQGKQNASFDAGLQVKRIVDMIHSITGPVYVFFDDVSYIADNNSIDDMPFAIEAITDINIHYRGLGLANWSNVQSLKKFDEAAAEVYKIKIITPDFAGINDLQKLNVPESAIKYLRETGLLKNQNKHLNQYMVIYGKQRWELFFPFTPPCNHFTDIYPIRVPKEVAA